MAKDCEKCPIYEGRSGDPLCTKEKDIQGSTKGGVEACHEAVKGFVQKIRERLMGNV